MSFNFDDKIERVAIRKQHIRDMETLFGDDILYSVNNSRIYGPEFNFPMEPNKYKETIMKVVKCCSDRALFNNYEDTKKIALLNFASYKEPGGRFLDGSRAQEEALCDVSTLYNVLFKLPDYYEWNKKNLNKGLYTNRAIYSPGIRFLLTWSQQYRCDVITCAAPNNLNAIRYNAFTPEENYYAIGNRVKFIRDICLNEMVDKVILGAWGCGVFKQDPEIVARFFMLAFQNTGIEVIFAVPDETKYNIFKNVLEIINRKEEA